MDKLSKQQKRILTLLYEGKSRREITLIIAKEKGEVSPISSSIMSSVSRSFRRLKKRGII